MTRVGEGERTWMRSAMSWTTVAADSFDSPARIVNKLIWGLELILRSSRASLYATATVSAIPTTPCEGLTHIISSHLSSHREHARSRTPPLLVEFTVHFVPRSKGSLFQPTLAISSV